MSHMVTSVTWVAWDRRIASMFWTFRIEDKLSGFWVRMDGFETRNPVGTEVAMLAAIGTVAMGACRIKIAVKCSNTKNMI